MNRESPVEKKFELIQNGKSQQRLQLPQDDRIATAPMEDSMEIIVIDEELLTLKVYPELKIVTHQLHGFVEGDPFKNMLMTGLNVFRKYNCNGWLSDDSKNSMVSRDDLEWGRAVWEPKMFETEWKYWALVLPEKLFGNMVMKRITKYYTERGINTSFFKSYEDAFNWLKALK